MAVQAAFADSVRRRNKRVELDHEWNSSLARGIVIMVWCALHDLPSHSASLCSFCASFYPLSSLVSARSSCAAPRASLLAGIAMVRSTYGCLGLYMNLVDIDRPWINAIVPTVGFWLSTLSLDKLRPIYLRAMFGQAVFDDLADPPGGAPPGPSSRPSRP